MFYFNEFKSTVINKMDFNKVTKAELQLAYTKLEAELKISQTKVKDLIEVANYFGANLSSIEHLITQAPFINKEGKFFKKVIWVITNFNSIKELIEQIALLIKNWRQRLNDSQALSTNELVSKSN